MQNIVVIHIFDDGNQKYESYVNKWKIIDTMFEGGKYKLQNTVNKSIVIDSISAWKCI
jgi:hypothetical protein